MVESIEEIVIYESPDGGKTIYARKPGQTNRTLVHVDPQHQLEQEFYQKWLLWRDILKDSQDNIGLQDLINKTEMMYNLLKNHQSC